MTYLKSKLQYSFFEIGEFVDEAIRSLKETVDLIEHYPWDEQRNATFLKVGLTGPSVTIEAREHQFLKIALYHYGWFIVYWIDEKGKLFLKVAENMETVISLTQQFFENRLESDDFKKYDEWIYDPLKHFETKTFEYKTTLQRSFYQVGGFVIAFIFLMKPMIKVLTVANSDLIIIIPYFLILSLLFSFPILLFLNYYFYSKKLFLKVSRCNDEFEFGKIGLVKKYNKQEIRRIKDFSCDRSNLKKRRGRGAPWHNFHVFVIEMKNGELLKFTSLMFGDSTFAYKFPEQKIKDEYLLMPTVQKATFAPLRLP